MEGPGLSILRRCQKNRQTSLGPYYKELLLGSDVVGIWSFSLKEVERTILPVLIEILLVNVSMPVCVCMRLNGYISVYMHVCMYVCFV